MGRPGRGVCGDGIGVLFSWSIRATYPGKKREARATLAAATAVVNWGQTRFSSAEHPVLDYDVGVTRQISPASVAT